MAFGNPGMIEILGGIARHAEAFHERPRGLIGRDSEGNNLVEVQGFEAKAQGGPGGFGGVAAALEFAADAPADFLAGGEVGLEKRLAEADASNEGGGGSVLDRKDAEALLREFILKSMC